jgi:2-polyprenyl-3-methyl-5-hydroxy-6-metoxy-1,4-benzoquinol methylase
VEDVRCPLCGGEPGSVVVAAADRLAAGSNRHHSTPPCDARPDATVDERSGRNDRSPTSFTVVRCRACGVAFTNPRPEAGEIGAFYPKGYNGDERSSGALARLEDAYRRRQQVEVVRWLAARRPARGELLDVGCGPGDLLLALRSDGWRVRGVEPSADGAHVARARGLEVVTGTFEDVELPGPACDAIVFSAVLEHIADPVGALRRARALLAPGGLIAVLHLPLLDSPQARLFGPRWLALDLPRHLTHFERATFAATAAAAGLRIVGREPYSRRHSAAQLVASALPGLQKHRFYLEEARCSP